MKVPYLSASRLNMFEECTKHYDLQYNQKVDVLEPYSAPMFIGKNLHLALELLYKSNGKKRLPKLLDAFDIACKKVPLHLEDYEDGVEILKKWWNERTIPDKVLSTEITFDRIIDGVPIKGIIDRVDEMEDGKIRLVDYKSNRMLMSREEVDGSNYQVYMYLLAARMLYPDQEYDFVFEFLRYGGQQMRTFRTKKQLINFFDWLKNTYETIRDMNKGTATTGSHCKWCNYSVICKEYQEMCTHKLGEQDLTQLENTIASGELVEILPLYDNINSEIAVLTELKGRISSVVHDNVGDGGYEDDNWKVALIQNKYEKYDKSTLINVLLQYPDIIEEVTEFKKGKVDKIIDRLKEGDREKVLGSIHVDYGKQYPKIKRK